LAFRTGKKLGYFIFGANGGREADALELTGNF
jgi:hypothetical protein